MVKRIVTKIGDIFRVELIDSPKWGIVQGKKYLRFFQYIANDMTCLNSSVIRVFKKKYPIEYIFNAEEIINDEIDFYAHTVLKLGIAENFWQKIGKSRDVGDTEHIFFRTYTHDAVNHRDRKWQMWQINKEWKSIGFLTPHYRSMSDLGHVFPYKSIVERMKTGQYPGTMFSPEEH